MFCPNCGTQTPDDSQFCAGCGNPLKGTFKPKVNINSSEISDFILTINKNPLSACKDYLNKLSTQFVLTYFALTAIIFSLINALSLKSIFSAYFNQVIKIFAKLGGHTIYPSDLDQITAPINILKETLFPFNKSFTWFLTYSLILYFIIILLTYIYHNVILKTNVKWKSYFIVASVAMTLQIEISLLALVSSLISLYLTFAILLLSTPLLIIVLYKGFGSFVENKPTSPYIFSCIYAIGNMISYFVFAKLIASHFIDLSLNGFSNILNLF